MIPIYNYAGKTITGIAKLEIMSTESTFQCKNHYKMQATDQSGECKNKVKIEVKTFCIENGIIEIIGAVCRGTKFAVECYLLLLTVHTRLLAKQQELLSKIRLAHVRVTGSHLL